MFLFIRFSSICFVSLYDIALSLCNVEGRTFILVTESLCFVCFPYILQQSSIWLKKAMYIINIYVVYLYYCHIILKFKIFVHLKQYNNSTLVRVIAMFLFNLFDSTSASPSSHLILCINSWVKRYCVMFCRVRGTLSMSLLSISRRGHLPSNTLLICLFVNTAMGVKIQFFYYFRLNGLSLQCEIGI